MRKFLILAIAVVVVTAWSSSDSMAQGYQQSYEFGVGLGYGTQFPYPNVNRRGYGGYGDGLAVRNRLRRRGIGTIGILPREPDLPPYFAMYPPVYYNGIVARPYGVSPFAAPPGIMPVEMMVPQVEPQSIHNPYFDQGTVPASDQHPAVETTDNKTTHIRNPYTESLVGN